MAITLAKLLVRLEADTTNFKRGISGSTKAVIAFGAAAAGILTATTRAAAAIETQRTALKNLTGSAREASRVFDDIQDFAVRTPFETDELLKSTTALIGFGRSADQALKDIKNLAAAAASSADADLGKIAVNFGQVSAAGKATARDLREFVNQGINVYQLLADVTGKNIAEIQKLQSEGKITGDLLAKAFAKAAGAGGRFENTLIDQSKTLNGLISTLRSQFNVILADLGESILPAAKKAAEALITAFNNFRKSIKENQQAIAKVGASLIAFIENINIFTKAVDNSLGPIRAVVKNILAWKTALAGDLPGALDLAKQSIKDYVSPIKNLTSLKDNITTITQSYSRALFELTDRNLGAVSATDRYKTVIDDTTKSIEEQTKKIKKNADILLRLPTLLNQVKRRTKEVEAQQRTKDITRLPRNTPFIESGGERTAAAQAGRVSLLTDTGVFDNLNRMRDTILQVQNEMQVLENLGFSFAQNFATGISAAIISAKSFQDAWKNVGKALAGVFKQLIADLITLIIKTLVLKAITAALSGNASAAADAAAGVSAFEGIGAGLGGLFGSAAGAGIGKVELFGRLSGQDLLLSNRRSIYLGDRLGR